MPPIMHILSKKDECISRLRKFSCLYDFDVNILGSRAEKLNQTLGLDFGIC